MYYCEYAHLLKKCMEHTCMSAIYYDQGSDIKVKQCKTIVTFDTIPESKILDAGDLLILSNLQKPWIIACKDISRVFEIEYSTYHILNRLELCEYSLTAGNYLLSYTNINFGNTPEARDGYFTTCYSFNKIILDVIMEKFDIQVCWLALYVLWCAKYKSKLANCSSSKISSKSGISTLSKFCCAWCLSSP